MITILNKVDRLKEGQAAERMELIEDLADHPVLVSAASGQGMQELAEQIYEQLQPLKEYKIRLPNTSQGLAELSRLYETAELLDGRLRRGAGGHPAGPAGGGAAPQLSHHALSN